MSSSNAKTFALFGAAPDTGNRGVSALLRCVLEAVGGAFPESKLLVFDNASGARTDSRLLENHTPYEFCRIGARGGRRYYRPENLATMAAFSSLGPAGRLHPFIRRLDACAAILDVSGGDSFSDIYGGDRFWSIARPKLIAKRRGIPLILLPQTYGPFQGRRARRVARAAVEGAKMAWARDRYSFEALRDLLGDGFDASHHRQGVDMAFNLRAIDPGDKVEPELRSWLGDARLVGVNVSGLITIDPPWAKRRFGLRASYFEAIVQAIESLMEAPDLRLVLVPHVTASPQSRESDPEACRRVFQALRPELRSRVAIAPTNLDECEVKWLISKTGWFCGTRMHSTIAALSSKVPTASVAYSDKTRGVFESCGVEDQVIDPRLLGTSEVVERLIESFERREQTKALLSTTIDQVKARATEQLRCIIEELNALR